MAYTKLEKLEKKDLHEIRVYDLLNYTKNKKYPKKIAANMINLMSSSLFKVNIMSVQQQLNAIDCGIFAIAFATDLLHGNPPSDVLYKHEKMQKHLFILYNRVYSCYFQEQV